MIFRVTLVPIHVNYCLFWVTCIVSRPVHHTYIYIKREMKLRQQQHSGSGSPSGNSRVNWNAPSSEQSIQRYWPGMLMMEACRCCSSLDCLENERRDPLFFVFFSLMISNVKPVFRFHPPFWQGTRQAFPATVAKCTGGLNELGKGIPLSNSREISVHYVARGGRVLRGLESCHLFSPPFFIFLVEETGHELKAN